MTPGSPAIAYDVTGGVATVTMDRPDTRNRLDVPAMTQLVDRLSAAAVDDAVRVVVLTGTGTAFCAGADLSAALSGDGAGFTGSGPAALVEVLVTMLRHPKPIIARVQGHVAGGGNGLIAACDIAVASSEARFAFSEVRVGVAPAVISVVCLRVMDPRAAQELLLTGERVDADRVLRAGLVTSVVPPDALDATVAAYAEAVMAGGPEAIRHTKDLLRRIPSMPLDEAFVETARLSAALFASDEAAEGMSAFLEKRTPRWHREA